MPSSLSRWCPPALLGGAALLCLVPPVMAQSTGSPVFSSPYRAFALSEWAISLSDPGPGYDLEGSYRFAFSRTGTTDLGLRGGVHGGLGPGHNALLLGADFRARLLTHSESFPLDGSLTLGVGMSSRNHTTVGYFPIGFSMGRRVLVEGSSISLVPYVQPVIMPLFADGSGTDVSIGFGLDARMTPRFDLRFSAAVGDVNGVGFTAAFLH
jgi:hypothetical protein